MQFDLLPVDCGPSMEAKLAALRGPDYLPERYKGKDLHGINHCINQYPYRPEQKDDWKSPQRFFKEGGDCEDFAIAKYHALKDRFPPCYVMVVRRLKFNDDHAVLLVENKFVLDNLTSKVRTLEYFLREHSIWYLADAAGVKVIKPGALMKKTGFL